ncbi:MAG TPA: hypothetical protein VLM78_08920 [Anaerolineales bacterium]|nr:hypothetical protein [Anaerolineales bacterium]
MARGGHKYPLIVYRHLLNRWWTPMFAIGLVMFALAYGEYTDPVYRFIPWRWQVFAGIGVLAILIGVFFLVIRQIAYIQPFPAYIKLVTPFMRVNISYKRLHKTTTAEMRQLFPPKSMSGWMRDIFSPLASQTAIILELKSYPVSPTLLRMFLSRFFFKDKTPQFVILVKDWMGLSTEIDSFRTGIDDPDPRPIKKRRGDSILSKLPRK